MDISGKIGVPLGQYLTLDKDKESAIDPGSNVGQAIQNNISLSTGLSNWIRASASGTKLAGQNVTVSRTAEGTYLLTAATAFSSSGGNSQYGVVVTPSTVSGNGGEGVSPFKAYDSVQAVVTDDENSVNHPMFFKGDAREEIFLLGGGNDKIWVHDLANFTGTPTEVNPNSKPIKLPQQSGTLSYPNGTYVVLSGSNADSSSVRLMHTGTS